MAVKTNTFSASNSGLTAVTADVPCASVEIREDPSVVGYPTQGYQVAAPTSADVLVQRQPGESFTFEAHGSSGMPGSQALFQAGQVVGYVQTLVSATTFAKVHK